MNKDELLRAILEQQQRGRFGHDALDEAMRQQAAAAARQAQHEFMQSRYPRPEPKPVHPWAFTPDLATVTSAVSLAKGRDGVWR